MVKKKNIVYLSLIYDNIKNINNMKFTKYLLRILIPEWVKFYVNFKLLKTYLSIMTILKTFLLDVK